MVYDSGYKVRISGGGYGVQNVGLKVSDSGCRGIRLRVKGHKVQGVGV
jgi:hypothetical protein